MVIPFCQNMSAIAGKPLTLELCLVHKSDKAKPAEKRGRKAAGPRFLREAMEDSPKDPKIAGLPDLHSNK